METPRIFAGDLLDVQVLGLVEFSRISLITASFGVLEIAADADFLILIRLVLTVKEKVAKVVSFGRLAIAASIITEANIRLRA